MDSVVTMSLEEYTKLVVENTTLKNKLQALKSKAIDKAFEEIHDSYIERIPTSEDAIKYMEYSVEALLGKFASTYSWTWRNIASESYGIVTEAEIKELTASEIKQRIDYRCKDLIESEKEVKENVD